MDFQKILQKLSDEFIEIWNSGEKEKLMSLFNEGTEYVSPIVSEFYPEKINNTLFGVHEINEYFSKLYKDKFPQLTRKYFTKKGRSLISYFCVIDSPIKLIVDIRLNEYGKIIYIETKYVNEFPSM